MDTISAFKMAIKFGDGETKLDGKLQGLLSQQCNFGPTVGQEVFEVGGDYREFFALQRLGILSLCDALD